MRKLIMFIAVPIISIGAIAFFLLSSNQSIEIQLTFDSNGGSFVSSMTYREDVTFTLPNDPNKEGYTFDGWFLDQRLETPFSVESLLALNPESAHTLYASWQINTYTLSFDSDGGSNIASITEDFNKTISAPNIPTKEGYTFDGWYLEESLTTQYTFSTMPAENMTLYANWKFNTYSIAFDSDGGSNIASITEDFNKTIQAPNIPTKEGYTFDGWYIDQARTQAYTFSTMPAENITLYASWQINTYTITFNSDGGSNITSITEDYNKTISAPNIPTKEGYTFDGWYIDQARTQAYTFSTMPAENITLYANWQINSYTVQYLIYDTFDASASIELSFGETIKHLATGESHSMIVTSAGRIYTWGLNSNGQLGDGTTVDKNTPIEITSQFEFAEGEVVDLASLGGFHSMITTSHGRVMLWGWNIFGQLGNGTAIDQKVPIDITSQFNLSPLETIEQINLGGYHSMLMTSSGRIFTWGWNGLGQLGDGTIINRLSPTDITSEIPLNPLEEIKYVYLGGSHSILTTTSERVFTWGRNASGQLGDGTNTNRNIPTEITSHLNLTDAIGHVTLGDFHSILTTTSGRIYTWGLNSNGQLGDGTTVDRNSPIEITTQFNFIVGEIVDNISLAGFQSTLVTSNNRIYTWGWNSKGQLGDGTINEANTPVEITSQFDFILDETIENISLGFYHGLLSTSTDRLYSWGGNMSGQLGDETIIDKNVPTLLPINTIHTQYQEVYDYQFTFDSSNIPTRAFYTLDGWYTDDTLTTQYILSTMPASNLSLYAKWDINTYTITFDSDGGSFVSSIIEDYNKAIREPNIPTKEGYTFIGWFIDQARLEAYTFVTMQGEDITLYASWQINTYTITFESDGGGEIEPITEDFNRTIIAPNIPTKEGHTFAGWYEDVTMTTPYLLTTMPAKNMTLYAKWNINVYLIEFLTYDDSDDSTTILLLPTETIKSVYAGERHSMLVTSTGRIFAWGGNSFGQLGDGTETNQNTPKEITAQFHLEEGELVDKIALGGFHSILTTTFGRIFTWGGNSSGQLGDGTFDNRSIPFDITSQFNFESLETVQSVSLSRASSMLVTSSGRVFIWGDNFHGLVGDGTNINRDVPTDVTSQFNLDALETIDLAVLGLWDHAMLTTSSGRVFTWGNNIDGQLGDGTFDSKNFPTEITERFEFSALETITHIDLGQSHSALATSNGRILMWGRNQLGQLGYGTVVDQSKPTDIRPQLNLGASDTIDDLSLGSNFSVLKTSSGRVFTWGDNFFGQLGDGTNISQNRPNEITTQFNMESLESIKTVSTGYFHTLIVTTKGRMITWGYNNFNQLGDGTNVSKNIPFEIYTNTFDLFGEGYIFNELAFNFNELLDDIPIPTRDGYTFDGWYEDITMTTLYEFTTMPAKNLRLFAQWEMNTDTVESMT